MSVDVVRWVEHGPAPGARNMAVDEALMGAGRVGEVVLRTYRWSPPCLSFGRNQQSRGRYDAEAAAERGIDLVRRPTGGRAVYHHRELTYAVAAPAGLWGGLRPSYRKINRALARGLRGLGVRVDVSDRKGRTPGPSASRACFRDPLPGELVAAGRKLVGSAQWRSDGALLQHGSVLLHDDQAVADRLRREEAAAAAGARSPGRGGSSTPADGPGEPAGSGAVSLAGLLDAPPEPVEVAGALREGFAAELELPVVDGELEPREASRARRLERRYRSDAWTWRR